MGFPASIHLTTSLARRPMQQLLTLLPLLALVLYMVNQNKKRQRAAASLAASVAPGVTVMTAGGIYGTVRTIDGDIVSLEIAPGVTIRIAQRAIGRVVDSPIVEATLSPDALDRGVDGTNDEDRA